MIPPRGDFTVLGQVWDTQGNIFKCKLNTSSGDDSTEYVEGTVLFLHKVKLAGDTQPCKDTSCKCSCHESSCDGELFRDAGDSLNESGFSSVLGTDESGKKVKPCEWFYMHTHGLCVREHCLLIVFKLPKRNDIFSSL